MAISFLTGQSIDGNLSVLGGSITLGGISGRISGIVTVLSGTDAANKAYVDAHVTPAGTYLPLAGGTMTGQLIINRNTSNYFEINSTNTGEAMTRYNNTVSDLWYTGIRSSSQLVGTTGYHIYSAAHGQTSFGITAGGSVIGNY